MDRALLNRVLEGDPIAAEQFGESDHCAVVDWKDGLEKIIAALADFLPSDHLRIEVFEGTRKKIVRADGMTIEMPSTSIKQEEIVALVNRVLAPRFEIRRFRPIDGDGYSLFVAPAELWAELEFEHPKETERYFMSAERLATYWRKSFVGRLFSIS